MKLLRWLLVCGLLIPAPLAAQVGPGQSVWFPITGTQFQGLGVTASVITSALSSQVARIVCTVACFFAFQPSGITAVPATLITGHFLPANLPEYFIIPRDAKVSAIVSSGGGTIFVTPMGR